MESATTVAVQEKKDATTVAVQEKKESSDKRPTSALFVPVTESLLLAVICSFLLHGFFSLIVPADYAVCIRAILMCSLVLNIATTALHAIIACAYKAKDLTFSLVGSWLQKISYHQALGVANAHCCSSCCLLITYLLMFLQIAAFSAELEPEAVWLKGLYTSSHASDWKQAVAGSSGEWQPSKSSDRKMFIATAAASSIPIAGGIYAGVLLAFLTVMFLVSIYAVFMAIPEEAGSYIFVEPKFLILLNGLLVMMSTYGVSNSYLYCYCNGCFSTSVLCILFSLFSVVTCLLDLGVSLVIPKNLYAVCRLGINVVLAAVPAFAALLTDGTPGMFLVASWILVVIAACTSTLEYLLFESDPAKDPAEDVPVADVVSSPPPADVAPPAAITPVPAANGEASNLFKQLTIPMREAWVLSTPARSGSSSRSTATKHHAA